MIGSPECLDDGRVRAFVSFQLSEVARRQVEDHVDDCDDCRKLLVALVRATGGAAEELPARERWEPGDRVGRYLIGRSVGRGAMGEVFRGDDTELARPVALKRLHVDNDAMGRARLVREARAAAQLQHPNVVAVYEIVDDVDGAVLATEWIDGVTLREWLGQTQRTWRETVRVVAGAGRGLAAAHAANIVHRDFKPENVLVDHAGRARVADFGLASGFDPVEAFSLRETKNVRLTVTGTLAGTPAYMAPELIDGAKPDARSDQFAFAVTLYESVYGKYPFAGTTAEAIWASMATGAITKTKRRRAASGRPPAWLDRALRKALSADPKDRFVDLAALLDLIDRRSSRSMRFPLAAAGAIGGIAVAGLLLLLPSDEKVPCGEELVDEVWSPSTRASYAKQFASVAPAHGAATLTFVDGTLEQWTGAWKLGRRAACSAAPAERRVRTACLDRQLGELRAQLAMWTRADASIVDRSPSAVAALPEPAECAAATKSAVSSEFYSQVTEIDVLRRAGKFVDMKAKVAALAEAAAREPDHESKARAFFAVAFVEYELRDAASARAHLASAAQAARKTGNDNLLINILILDASVRIVANNPAEALGILSAVGAHEPRGRDLARLESVRGEALAAMRRYPEAIEAYQHGVELMEEEVKRDPSSKLALAAIIGALGSTYGHSGKPVEGIAEMKRALAIEIPILGDKHPEVARTLHDLAYIQRDGLGEIEEAIKNYKQARVIFAASLGERSLEVASIDAAMADIASAAGDYDTAFKLATRAREEYLHNKANPALLASIENGLGLIHQNQDRCAKAIPHYEAGLAASLEAGETGARLGIAYGNLAACLADVKREAEARNAIESAIAAYEADPGDHPERSQAFAILGELEARAGRFKRAIEVAEQGLAVIKGVEGDQWKAMRGFLNDSIKLWRRGRLE